MLDDEESRYLTITALNAETDRDRQVKVGASNLSNGCDRCLASNLNGDDRSSPLLDRAWGGRTIGTAIHGLLESRINVIRKNHPDALAEHKMILGELGSYGVVGSTADLVLPSERQAFDYKGTTKQKMALLIDFNEIKNGRPAIYGRTHKDVRLSERVYADKLLSLEFTVTGYFGQASLYGWGLNRQGIPIERVTLNFISRDSTMWFDNPSQDRYTDPTAAKGVWSLGFAYNEQYALALWDRALHIWEKVESGVAPTDFTSHPQCFPCNMEAGR